MDNEDEKEVIDFMTSNENKWTLIISSKNEYWKQKCGRTITMSEGKIIADSKKIKNA